MGQLSEHNHKGENMVKKTIAMEDNDINNLVVFLRRTTLKGEEVPSFNRIVQIINDAMIPKDIKKEKVDEEEKKSDDVSST